LRAASTSKDNSRDDSSPALVLATLGFAGAVPATKAQDTLGGHIGFVLPLVTRAGGQTTTMGSAETTFATSSFTALPYHYQKVPAIALARGNGD